VTPIGVRALQLRRTARSERTYELCRIVGPPTTGDYLLTFGRRLLLLEDKLPARGIASALSVYEVLVMLEYVARTDNISSIRCPEVASDDGRLNAEEDRTHDLQRLCV